MTHHANSAIEKKLGEYIQALTSPDITVSRESTLQEMQIDSIALVKIFVFIEKQFGISLINAGLSRQDIETFGSLVNHISEQQ